MLRTAPSTPTQLQRQFRRGLHDMRHSPHCRHLHYYSCLLVLTLYAYFALSSTQPPHAPADAAASSVPLSKHTFTQLSDDGATGQPELLFVQLLHRHGDRTPIHAYPPSHLWDDYPLPPGSLTSIGWAQHNAVGRALQQRYMRDEPLLSPYQYRPHSLVVRSTEVERCIQSVTALLSALYPPQLNHSAATDAAEANHRTTLTPYPPVSVMPMPLDYLLQSTDKCPAYSITYPATQAASDAVIHAEHPTLMADLTRLTGIPGSQTGDSVALHVSWTADNLLCEQAHNLSYSAELTAMSDMLYNLSRYVNFHRFVGAATERRGSIGDTLLRDTMVSVLSKIRVDLAENDTSLPACRADNGLTLEQCWEDPYVEQRLRIYSAHDTTIVALLASLHLLNATSPQLLPEYATVVSLELRRTDSGRYTMGWRYGAPVEHESGSGEWDFDDQKLAMPCPDDGVVERGADIPLATECDVASVLRYVLIMTDPAYDSGSAAAVQRLPTLKWSARNLTDALGLFHLDAAHESTYAQNTAFPLLQYPSDDGCCVPPADLATQCPPNAAFADVKNGCRLLRRLCPAVACGSGRVVDTATLDCVLSDALRSAVVDTALIVGSAVIAALLCAVFWLWTRHAAAAAAATSGGGAAMEGGSGEKQQAVGEAVRKGQQKVQAVLASVTAGVKERAKERRKRRQRGGERGNTEEREKLELADMEVYELGDEAATDGEGGDTVLFDDEHDAEEDEDVEAGVRAMK